MTFCPFCRRRETFLGLPHICYVPSSKDASWTVQAMRRKVALMEKYMRRIYLWAIAIAIFIIILIWRA